MKPKQFPRLSAKVELLQVLVHVGGGEVGWGVGVNNDVNKKKNLNIY